MKMISLREVLFLCLVCIGIVVAVDGGIAVGPRNQAVIVGQRMAMECRADGNSSVFKWQMAKPSGRQKERIAQTSASGKTKLYADFQKFSYDRNAEGTVVVVFTNSTELKDAGIYFCYVNPEQLQSSAHLIVFESEPSCDFNHTSSDNLTFALGDLISMRCTANFSGLWTPSVEWRQRPANSSSEDDEGGEVLTKGVTTESSVNIGISSQLNVVIDFQQLTYFSFRIFFRWRNDTISVNATNLPDFEYEWKSPEVIVVVPETEVAELPVVVQVIVETVTSEVGSAGNWYLMSLLLLMALLVFVFSIVGLIARRCYAGYRRVNGLEQPSRSVNATVLRGLERPASGDYDVIAFSSPNIYETINDNEAARATATCAETTCQEQQQQQHRPLTETYSQLSHVSGVAEGAYDALSIYLPMDSPPSRASHSHPLASFEDTTKVNSEHLGTSASKSSDTGKTDYLTLVELGEQSTMKVGSTGGDIDDYVHADDDKAAAASAVDRFVAKATDDDGDGDYLVPCS